VVVSRYVTPVDIIIWISNAICFSALLDARLCLWRRNAALGQR
jgi:hypothetical protein